MMEVPVRVHRSSGPRLGPPARPDRKARAGSCIFIHLQLPGKTGTNGCVALPEPQLEALQDHVQSGAVLAILPRQALDRFKGCLPTLTPSP